MAKKRNPSPPPPAHEKPISKKQKPGHEIEEIFKKKRKKPEKTDPDPEISNTDQENMKKEKKKKKNNENSKKNKVSFKGDGPVDPPPRPRRKTQDGFTIYSAEELGIGKDSGGTPLCPFDCSCCF
ncbi:uncharacterized protein C6G9.01c [Magnolia sinica]|uniref:uncharacterized protein C6G9.01c n=1 Tax=Magnolia sinica TaxID=86752 RepID=UPI00265B6137|nr:uncharacterized protein C6G9.01c [Magnolia sinica]